MNPPTPAHPAGFTPGEPLTTRNMDVFSLRDTVVGEYETFATSFTRIFARDIHRQVKAIYAEKRYWPEPLIQINPNYKRTKTVAAPSPSPDTRARRTATSAATSPTTRQTSCSQTS